LQGIPAFGDDWKVKSLIALLERDIPLQRPGFLVKDDGLQWKWEDLDNLIGRGLILGIIIMLQNANMKLNMELESGDC